MDKIRKKHLFPLLQGFLNDICLSKIPVHAIPNWFPNQKPKTSKINKATISETERCDFFS